MLSKFVRVLFLGSIFGGVLHAESFHEDVRDLNIEAVIISKYVFNSNCVVEIDEKNYPELDHMVTDLAKKAGIKKPLTFLITRKFPAFFDKANACAAGDKEKSIIFLGAWIVDKLSRAELEGVLAHEIIHIVKNHTNKMAYGAMMTSFAVFGAMLAGELAALKMNKNIWLFMIPSAIAASIVSSLGMAKYKRRFEKEADLGALDLVGHAELAGSLEKLENIANRYLPYTSRKQKEWSNRIFADHPLTEKRLEYIAEYRQQKGLPAQKAVAA